jgi:hypothetical protein
MREVNVKRLCRQLHLRGHSGWSCAVGAATLRNQTTLALSRRAGSLWSGIKTNNEPAVLVDGRCLATSEDLNRLYQSVRYTRPYRAHLVHASYNIRTLDEKHRWEYHLYSDKPHHSPNGRRFVVVRSCDDLGIFAVYRSGIRTARSAFGNIDQLNMPSILLLVGPMIIAWSSLSPRG